MGEVKVVLRVRNMAFKTDPCENQPHKGHLTSKLNSKTVPVLPSLKYSRIFPFHLLPSPVHPTRFSSCFFPGCLRKSTKVTFKKYIFIRKPIATVRGLSRV